MAERSLGGLQREWGFKLAGLSPEGRDAFIRGVAADGDGLALWSLLIALKFRFDCPDFAFDLLDEIHALQARKAPEAEFVPWTEHARSLLLQYIGDEPKSDELLRPASSSRIN
jgi:hypothetical protein